MGTYLSDVNRKMQQDFPRPVVGSGAPSISLTMASLDISQLAHDLAAGVKEAQWIKVCSLSLSSSFRIRDNGIERTERTWYAMFPSFAQCLALSRHSVVS